ncbi:hypothetical protein [uncultured Microbulbifer sp.]|uniref:hypothetical protein n=1 Tax=uncultured Microbulbifer sp. TaxID=348147 RepID=UPI0026054AD3|nr:hypothetical protein [uncultured Microbulbifer sp.]
MNSEKTYFFDNPDNIRKVLRVFYATCFVLFALDFVIHRHTEYRWEGLPGFYPVYGFVGCVALVVVAKWMRTFLMRPEDYYDKRELADDDEPDDIASVDVPPTIHLGGGRDHA